MYQQAELVRLRVFDSRDKVGRDSGSARQGGILTRML